MSSIFKLYTRILTRYPMTCQCVQTGILMATGDVVAQTLVEKKPIKKMNFKRTAQFFAIGAVFIGPTLTVWYKTLAEQVGSSGKTAALKKVAIDQVIFAPICSFLILTCINTMQGKNLDQVKEAVYEQYWPVLMTNFQIWPAVQLINFYFVPLQYQVLLVQVVAIFWNAFLSYTTRPDKN